MTCRILALLFNIKEVFEKLGWGFLYSKIYFSIYFHLKTPNKHSCYVNKSISQLKIPLNW